MHLRLVLYFSLFKINIFVSYTKSVKKSYQLDHFTSAFAFCSDVSLTLGGKLKFAEMLSGRYADILSNIFLGYATLWFTSKHSDIRGMGYVRDYAMQVCLLPSYPLSLLPLFFVTIHQQVCCLLITTVVACLIDTTS